MEDKVKTEIKEIEKWKIEHPDYNAIFVENFTHNENKFVRIGSDEAGYMDIPLTLIEALSDVLNSIISESGEKLAPIISEDISSLKS